MRGQAEVPLYLVHTSHIRVQVEAQSVHRVYTDTLCATDSMQGTRRLLADSTCSSDGLPYSDIWRRKTNCVQDHLVRPNHRSSRQNT